MFGRKKYPVLTGTFCAEVGKLRTAIEVLTGRQVQLLQLDLNTGNGKIGLGNKDNETTYREFEVTFFSAREDLIEFKLDCPLNTTAIGWNVAHFEKSGKVLVMNQDNPKVMNNVLKMRWVGYSATDRWEEPLRIREVQEDANRRGLTLQEHLRRLNIPSPPPRYFGQLKAGDTFLWGGVRCIVVASLYGPAYNFAVPLEGEQRGTIIHPSRYADIRQVA